jgi:hypothetical protein
MKYKAKVFLAFFCVTFGLQVLLGNFWPTITGTEGAFTVQYEYFRGGPGGDHLLVILLVAVLLSSGLTFFWTQFKKP